MGLIRFHQIDLIGTSLFNVTQVYHPRNNATQEPEINNNGIAETRVRS